MVARRVGQHRVQQPTLHLASLPPHGSAVFPIGGPLRQCEIRVGARADQPPLPPGFALASTDWYAGQ
jgi:hypothetical protein